MVNDSMNIMETIKFGLIIFFALLVSIGCDKENNRDDELTIIMTPYTGDQLRIDGYYYTELQTFEGVIYNRYAFYINGIVRYLGSAKSLEESNFVQGNVKHSWGVFLIENGDIKFELWYPSSGGGWPAYIRAGTILNDTTFHITESYRMQNGQKTEVDAEDEIYHFRHYSPKPDSTNPYIP